MMTIRILSRNAFFRLSTTKRSPFSLLFVVFIILYLAHNAYGRINILTGGITTAYDYDKTNRQKDSEKVAVSISNSDKSQLSIGPLITFESNSSVDRLTIRLNPSFGYDFGDTHSDIDHDYSISAYRDLNKNIRLSLSNSFIYSDDPKLIQSTDSFDYKSGRKRFLTNDFNINTTYAYNTESHIGGGYTYKILRNENTGIGGYEDYDKHVADLNLQHHVNSSWNITATTSYTRGLFDPPDQEIVTTIENELESLIPGSTEDISNHEISNDLSEYRAGTTLNLVLSKRKTFLAGYDFMGTDYDNILRFDSNIHNFKIGTSYQFNKRLSINLGGGPSYIKTETLNGDWNYNAHLNGDYDFSKHSTFRASSEKGYTQKNFSQNNNSLGRDEGLTEFWEWKLALAQQILKDLKGNIYVSYRNENQRSLINAIETDTEEGIQPQATDQRDLFKESIFNRDIYITGGTLNYTFMKYWSSNFDYSFRKQQSQWLNDSYDEHRLLVTLTFQKELLRW